MPSTPAASSPQPGGSWPPRSPRSPSSATRRTVVDDEQVAYRPPPPVGASSAARGYGTEHRRRRARLVTRYEQTGRGWPCALCGVEMHDPPARLHLAHHPDSTSHAGLAHQVCNLGQAAAKGNRTRWAGDPDPQPRTRW